MAKEAGVVGEISRCYLAGFEDGKVQGNGGITSTRRKASQRLDVSPV